MTLTKMINPQPNTNLLLNGDCLQVLKELPDNSVDTLITDPPYGLSFMGKKWDYDVPSVDVWKEVLRVLKPGATALIFAGSRTQHRMACNVEDAGFELRDCIMWIYGSGFPKSFNIGKGIDKVQGNERISTGQIKHHAQKGVIIAEERGAIGGGAFGQAKDEEITVGTSPFEGYGTQLKPAYEPIIVAMKPNDGNFVNNALKWGVAGLNIDAGRISCGTEHMRGNVGAKIEETDWKNNSGLGKPFIATDSPLGRFPANVIFDEEAGKVLDEQSGISKSSDNKWNGENNANIYGKYEAGIRQSTFSDKGGASRFFYCAKASKSERNAGCEDMPLQHYLKENKMGGEGDTMLTGSGNPRDCRKHNNHPTVKPLKLMEYLCKITRTPTGGVVLDPFLGSGTTAVACIKTNRNFIGIEREADYIKIAEARIKQAEEKNDRH